MRILGIDYGFGNTGYTISDLTDKVLYPVEMNVIQTSPSHKKQNIYVEDDNIGRLKYIVDQLVSLIESWDVRIITMEAFTSNIKNTNTTRKNYGVVAAIASISQMKNIPLFTVTPNQIKIGIANKKSASKAEIIDRLNKNWPILSDLAPKAKTKHEHCYDGFATIVIALKQYSVMELL